jgi:hypothetical protein
MVHWEQVINEMQLPPLVDPGEPTKCIKLKDGWQNERTTGMLDMHVPGFSRTTPPNPNAHKASERIDDDTR